MSINLTTSVISGSRYCRLGPQPSQAEIDELFIRWREGGDPQAREELVRHYLPLAARLARRYRGAREPADDLQQVASLGLLKAMNRYDPSRGTGFKAYVVPTILGEIKRYFRDCGWMIHVPRTTQDMALRVEQAQRTLLERTGRPPTLQQLADHLEMSVEDVGDAAEAAGAHHSASLDAPYLNGDGDGENCTVGDKVGSVDERYERIEENLYITQASRQLTQRERRVLRMRFVDDRSQVQIAAEIGVSQMQVSRILAAALDRLGAIMDAELSRA